VRAVVQRVSEAAVTVDGETVGAIGPGLLVLVGVGHDDDDASAAALAARIAKLRIFADEAGQMNRSVLDTGGAILAVSQFTLLADTRKGNRPSFIAAARPEQSEPLYRHLVATLRGLGIEVATGRFGAEMRVALVNDGPVTIVF
jgi:D-tyrosyl-tRNA(Tyr) deacylase